MFQCLKIQHHIGIIADILADFIHAEDHMMIIALAFNAFADELCKVLRADAVFFTHTLTPAASRFFGPSFKFHKSFYKRVLHKVNARSRIFPAFSCQFRDSAMEFFKFSLCIQFSFQIGHAGILVGIAQFLIECTQKNHGDHVTRSSTACAALGGDIKQDHIRINAFCCTDVRQNFRIGNLVIFNEIVQCRFSGNLIIIDQIREHLQKVRFTAAKEA